MTGNRCPCCERPLEQRTERDGLIVMSEPWRVYWRGKLALGLTPMATRFLFMLLRSPDGRVAASSFDMMLRDGGAASSTKVHMHRLRRWLEAAGLPFVVFNLHGWGYQLIAQDLPS